MLRKILAGSRYLIVIFIDESLPTPKWLMITSLDDLKTRLLGVVVVLLAVTFLGEEVNWNGSNNIVAVGIAVGLVLFALGFILRQGFEVYAGRRTKESDVE